MQQALQCTNFMIFADNLTSMIKEESPSLSEVNTLQ
jgi:hypothetical protein